MKKIIIYIILFVLPISFISCNAESSPKKEFTENQEKNWHSEKLNDNLSKIEYIDNSVHFVSGGRFGIFSKSKEFPNEKDWATDFTLKKGEKFYNQPDHHACIDYEIIDFDKNSVKLKYTSSFDHRSFGNNLITTDKGVIELKYK